MKLMFSAINCTLDTSNGAAISIKTFLRYLGRQGVECRSLSAAVYDRPGPGGPIDNLTAVGAQPVEEPGYPQTLWLRQDETVQHYVVATTAMTQRAMSVADEQVLYNRALAVLDAYQPDVLLLYGNRRYEMSLLKKARERGIATVFYLVNPGYRRIDTFQHVDRIFTDTEATRQLFAERFGFDCKVIGKFVEPMNIPPSAGPQRFVTFINPSPEKGVTLFLRIVQLARQVVPDARFLVVESRATLASAEQHTGLSLGRGDDLQCIGLQTDMGAVYGATKILLAPSLWHESGPRVAVEAMSLGIPTIGSNRGGLPGVVGDAGIVIDPPPPLIEQHWLVPPLSDAIPWVDAIRNLLGDDALYDEYRQAALRRWAEHDPVQRMGSIVEDLERVVAERRRSVA